MAYIYIIKNDINDKVYIGKTEYSIEKRFKAHLCDSDKRRTEKRPLYRAISKYGKDHFWVEHIEECSTNEASNREKYWIEQYDSFNNGYNATIGGDGSTVINHQLVLQLYDDKAYFCASEIAEKVNCSTESVKNIVALYRDNIDWKDRYSKSEKSKQHLFAKPKPVLCVEKQKMFESTMAAERWLIENGITSSKKSRSHISAVCKGKRKRAYGYTWKYI